MTYDYGVWMVLFFLLEGGCVEVGINNSFRFSFLCFLSFSFGFHRTVWNRRESVQH